MGTSGKETIEVEDVNLDDHVVIYPLTMKNVTQFKKEKIAAHSNLELEQARAAYVYTIGAGDVLNIVVYDHPELTTPAGAYRSAQDSGNWVSQDGHIFYPYIGRLQVVGLTVDQVRDDLTRRLKKYIEKPQVTVTIASFRSQRVYVTGEINKPGMQHLTNIPLTLLDAVNLGGGLSEKADWRHVSLTRQGKKEVLSLHGLMQQGDLTQNRLLQAGDIIHVPRNDDLKVFVMGEVNENKLLKMDRSGMSLTEALSAAGGLDQLSADATGIFVIRAHPEMHTDQVQSDKAHIYQLDVQDAASLVIGTEFQLQPYDLVYVTAAPITRWNRVIQQLLPTLKGLNSVVDSANKVKSL
tara:strand:- start:1570 stop:2625 length:1056 start_codon:yes stop_codon:yes gene_type:complete